MEELLVVWHALVQQSNSATTGKLYLQQEKKLITQVPPLDSAENILYKIWEITFFLSLQEYFADQK